MGDEICKLGYSMSSTAYGAASRGASDLITTITLKGVALSEALIQNVSVSAGMHTASLTLILEMS